MIIIRRGQRGKQLEVDIPKVNPEPNLSAKINPSSEIKDKSQRIINTRQLLDTHNMNNTLSAMRNTKGQFFGLTTKTETLNAQFRGETPSYVKVWDRNNNEMRRFHKNSLVKVNIS